MVKAKNLPHGENQRRLKKWKQPRGNCKNTEYIENLWEVDNLR